MAGERSASTEKARSAEIVAVLCRASDLAMGLPLEHGLQSTLIAMRLGQRLGIDAQTASDTYYACLVFHAGCTADAEVASELFGTDNALLTEFVPVMFGTRRDTMAGVMRALASGRCAVGPRRPDGSPTAERGSTSQAPYRRRVPGGADVEQAARRAAPGTGAVRLPH